jgi:hypothetical protein
MSFNIRLLKLLDHYKMNPTRFSKELGFANPENIRRLTKEADGNPGLQVLFAILKRFPEISAHWLITGEEPVFRISHLSDAQIAMEGEGGAGLLEKLLKATKEVGALEGEVRRLLNEVEFLRAQIRDVSHPEVRAG